MTEIRKLVEGLPLLPGLTTAKLLAALDAAEQRHRAQAIKAAAIALRALDLHTSESSARYYAGEIAAGRHPATLEADAERIALSVLTALGYAPAAPDGTEGR